MKTINETITEIERASQMEALGFKTDPRNEVAEAIVLEFLKSQQWVGQKSLLVIQELQSQLEASKKREWGA